MSTRAGTKRTAAAAGGMGQDGGPPGKKPAPNAGGSGPPDAGKRKKEKDRIRREIDNALDLIERKIEKNQPYRAMRIHFDTHVGDYPFDNNVTVVKIALRRPAPFGREIFSKNYLMYSICVIEELTRDLHAQLAKYQRWVDYSFA